MSKSSNPTCQTWSQNVTKVYKSHNWDWKSGTQICSVAISQSAFHTKSVSRWLNFAVPSWDCRPYPRSTRFFDGGATRIVGAWMKAIGPICKWISLTCRLLDSADFLGAHMSAKGRYMFVAHGKFELTNEAIYNWVSNIALKQLKIIRNPITVHRPYSSSMFNCVKYLLSMNHWSMITMSYWSASKPICFILAKSVVIQAVRVSHWNCDWFMNGHHLFIWQSYASNNRCWPIWLINWCQVVRAAIESECHIPQMPTRLLWRLS